MNCYVCISLEKMILLICIQLSLNERDKLIKLLVKEINNNRFNVRVYYLVVYNSVLSLSKALKRNIQKDGYSRINSVTEKSAYSK